MERALLIRKVNENTTLIWNGKAVLAYFGKASWYMGEAYGVRTATTLMYEVQCKLNDYQHLYR